MAELTAGAGDLENELRGYFALTTSTELPRRVREMGVRTLVRRQRRSAWLPGGVGALAAAALVLVIVTLARPGTQGGTNLSLSNGAGGSAGSAFQAPAALAPLAFGGIDAKRLATSGVRLLQPPAGARVTLSAAAAQAAAVAAVGGGAGTAAPAVLTLAQLAHAQQGSCVCWAVEVPVGAATTANAGASPRRFELVLVDAVTGRIDAVLSGNGIP
jgi:hypothetical protein